MSDNRLDVKISLIGADDKKHTIYWSVNWEQTRAEKLYEEPIELAQEAQLPVEDKKYLFKT